MNQEESIRLILHRYKENPYFDDSDLYYNGLCDSTEFLDHRPDKSYKEAGADSIMSRWKKQQELLKEAATKKPEGAIKKSPVVDYIPRNSMCNDNTTSKQPELIPSSKEAQKTNIRLTFKLNGNKVQSVRRSDDIPDASRNILLKKRSYFEDEVISIPKRIKMSDEKPVVKHFTKLLCISST